MKLLPRAAEPAPGRIGMEPPGREFHGPVHSPYPFLPPLRCVTCDDILPAGRSAGRCTYCRKLKSDLRTGRKHPTDWGTSRTRRLQVIIWHELTGETLTDPYAPDPAYDPGPPGYDADLRGPWMQRAPEAPA